MLQQDLQFMKQVLTGERAIVKYMGKQFTSSQKEYLESYYNPSQQSAIRQAFFNEGISIIQGPPGIG